MNNKEKNIIKNKVTYDIILIKQSNFEESLIKKFLTTFSETSPITLKLKASFDLEFDDSQIIPGITAKKLGLIRINKFLNQIKEKDVDCSNYIILSLTNDILETYNKNKLFPQEITYAIFYYNDNLIFSNSYKSEIDPKLYLEYISNQDKYEKSEVIDCFVNRVRKPKGEGWRDEDLEILLKDDAERVQDCLEKGFGEVVKVLQFFQGV